MKLNFFPTIISIGISSLISYGFYTFHDGLNKDILAVGSFLFLTITLIGTLGVSFENPRKKVNFKTISALFFVISIISNFIFLSINHTLPMYVIVNGILFMIYLLIVQTLYKLNHD
jgi:hypothetical protein